MGKNQAEIMENSTDRVCVTSNLGVGVEEGRLKSKLQQDEAQSRYLTGSKLIFLFLWV